MSARWRHRLRHLRRALAYGLAVVLILMACVAALASQLLPLVERNPERIAQWLSRQVGREVRFDRATARWTRSGPLIGLEGLRIGPEQAPLTIDRAQLLVTIYTGLLPGQPLTRLRLEGSHLSLTRAADGAWSLQGLGQGGTAEEDPLSALSGFGELQLHQAALAVADHAAGWSLQLPRLDLRLRVDGERLRAGMLAWTDSAEQPLAAVLDLDREHGKGRLWVQAQAAGLTGWSELLTLGGVEPLAGGADLQAWIEFAESRPVAVDLDARLTGLALRGRTPIAGGDGPIEPRLGLERFEAVAHWRRGAQGWRLDVPRLYLATGSDETRLDGLAIATDERAGASLEGAELRPLLALLALSDRLPPELRRWLYLAAPGGRIEQLRIAGAPGRGLLGQARVADLGWLPVARTPGLEGLGGEFRFDGQGVHWAIDPQAAVRVDWPGGFAQPQEVRLGGSLTAWRQPEGWHLATGDLHVGDGEVGLNLAAELALGAESGRRLDLLAHFDPGPLVALKRFFVLNAISPRTVEWLNRALSDGRLASGRVLLGGALADWPFLHEQGRLQADLRIEQAPLLYSSTWPAAERLDADLHFGARSVEISGSGVLGGAEVERVQASIADFSRPILDLSLQGQGRGQDLLGVVKHSSLMLRHGDTLSGLFIGGRGQVAMNLRWPLREDLGEPAVRGTVDLAEAPIEQVEWGVAFDRADGRLRFGDEGLSADELQVRLGEDVGSFSLALGGFASDPDLSAEASLRGRFPAQTLLAHAPSLGWLAPYLQGRSDWTLGLSVERGKPDAAPPPPRIVVQSDLRGIALKLPAPLRKAPEQALPLWLAMSLPVEAEPLRLRLGSLLTLDAVVPADGGIRGLLAFGGASGEAGSRGLRVVGQVPSLDLAAWAGFATDRGGQGVIEQVDVHAGELDILNRAFVETGLRLDTSPEGTVLRLDGAEIAGRLSLPADSGQPIAGDFEHLHWPAGRPASGAGGLDPDPVGVPPLRFTVADLRFGQARLGQARLDTYPTPEGMHFERLSTQSKMLALDASGDWTRLEGSTRSRFAIEFRAKDLGKMLDALGFSGLVEGGKTQAKMVASWSGSPAAFSLERLEGELSLDVDQGRFLDVEPGGAGRMLGLISVAEIPRRLLLDFSDLFAQGLSFNSIKGSFQFGGGQARTENLDIKAPSAEIRLRGRTGLKARDYDQTIEVLPKASSMLPALGAIAGGPAGVAIGALAQALFQGPLKRASRTLYHVTGPWQDPQVEVLERGPAERPAAASKGGSAAAGR